MKPARSLALLGFALLAACGALEPGTVPEAELPDPTTIARTGWPNDWLICPEGACAAAASAPAPVYPVAPERLFAAWRELLAAQPRTAVIGTDPVRLLILAQDRTPLLGFVDTISIRVLPVAGTGSTFAAYSRSNIGLSDLGTNRKRLEGWIGVLAVGAPGS